MPMALSSSRTNKSESQFAWKVDVAQVNPVVHAPMHVSIYIHAHTYEHCYILMPLVEMTSIL